MESATKSMNNQTLNRRNPRQARSQHKVELMLEAAMQLLETGDIASLTTNAVAAKAGVSIGTLYQYFGSKHALLDALVTRELGAMTDKIVDSMQRATPTAPGDPIREIVRAVTASYGGRNRVHRLLMEHSSTSNAQGGRLAPFYARLLEISTADEVAMPDGHTRKPTEAEAFVLTFAVTGVLRMLAASADPPPLQEVEDALVRLVTGFTAQRSTPENPAY
ncbi:AcrR family transcriptional regulator [Paraburkholderia sp. GAS38]|uniref:TetR/AcrR family transcriptional regulator n=1 Tax=Paraburkholderia sp. GAS38 TaxID=3035133 RepID=UPI003D1C84EA